MFVDSVKVKVIAGDGGNGIVSFRREKFVPKGGPDGGDGGNGGSIYFVADRNVDHLIALRYKPIIKAKRGAHGQGKKKRGRDGEDVYIKVPVGTIVKELETGKIVADLKEHGQKFLAAKGGRGGRGNARFATPTRQAPDFSEHGKKGEEKEYILELKTIADVGLVGFPNSGKSTFIRKVSRAKPEVAPYPFTTLTPHPGIVELKDFRSFIIADIPGIIEGASKGKGLGLRFLKHIERTKIIAYFINMDPYFDKKPHEQFLVLERELKDYSEELSKKPYVIVLNKIDLFKTSDEVDKHGEKLIEISKERNIKVFEISALSGKGISELLENLYSMIKNINDD